MPEEYQAFSGYYTDKENRPKTSGFAQVMPLCQFDRYRRSQILFSRLVPTLVQPRPASTSLPGLLEGRPMSAIVSFFALNSGPNTLLFTHQFYWANLFTTGSVFECSSKGYQTLLCLLGNSHGQNGHKSHFVAIMAILDMAIFNANMPSIGVP